MYYREKLVIFKYIFNCRKVREKKASILRLAFFYDKKIN